MLEITPSIKLKSGGLRFLSALINYLEDEYLIETWNRSANTSIFYNERQVNILKRAAYLKYELWGDQTTETFKDVFGKEQTFSKEDLLTFADNLNSSTLTVYYLPKKKTNKLTKERLVFMYVDCVNKLYELAKDIFPKCEGNVARKINHYRQLLANNRDTWDYLSVKDMPSVGFYLKYNYRLNAKALDLNLNLSIKDILYTAKQIINPYVSPWATKPTDKDTVNIPERTIEWELEQYAKRRTSKLKSLKAFSNQYKITITDEATGDVVQEFYLPKN